MKVLRVEEPYDPRAARREAMERRQLELSTTGIRRTEHGSWAAVVEGRLVGVWSGAGSRLRAIRAAGTNERII